MYIVASLIVLSMGLVAVTAVLDTVIDTFGLSKIREIPIVGKHLDVLIAIGMVWLLDIQIIEHLMGGFRSDWMGIVLNGTAVIACIPLKDAVFEAIRKGLARV
ncbi:MAG: hypothetical protein P8J50_19875 [Acidimicrobiales bacterium]|jgi:hypothetical protein|nr:hypothetical protein [Acidimicrobiales bacterium]